MHTRSRLVVPPAGKMSESSAVITLKRPEYQAVIAMYVKKARQNCRSMSVHGCDKVCFSSYSNTSSCDTLFKGTVCCYTVTGLPLDCVARPQGAIEGIAIRRKGVEPKGYPYIKNKNETTEIYTLA